MLFISALAATALLSCSKSSDDSDNGKGNLSDDPIPVRFSQSIEAVVNQTPEADSKAVVDNKFNNEDFVAYAVEHTGTLTWKAANFMDGITLSADGSGAITYKTASEMKYYSNAADAQYQFYAIHPSTLTIAPAEAGKAPVVTVPAGTDLLVASAASTKSQNAVELPFVHKMAQLVIHIETERVPNPELKINSVTVSVQTEGTLSLGGEVQPDGSAAEKRFRDFAADHKHGYYHCGRKSAYSPGTEHFNGQHKDRRPSLSNGRFNFARSNARSRENLYHYTEDQRSGYLF